VDGRWCLLGQVCWVKVFVGSSLLGQVCWVFVGCLLGVCRVFVGCLLGVCWVKFVGSRRLLGQVLLGGGN
jgi:hypothetical protein